MDAARFDAMIRALSTNRSRRRALGTVLGGFLGILPLVSDDRFGVSAAKSCKGLKGKKKKKCLKKAKAGGCRQDADCRDQIESCQGGKCKLVCQNGSCPGCDVCLIRYESDGDRTRRCAGLVDLPALLTSCTSDQDCPNDAPLCISFNELSCTSSPCGTCAIAIGSCDEPECQNDADCPNLAEACQAGSCQPVCPAGACGSCAICTVRYESNGDRTRICADQLIASNGAIDCTSDANCPVQDPICVGVSPVLCAQPPCRQCFTVDTCTP